MNTNSIIHYLQQLEQKNWLLPPPVTETPAENSAAPEADQAGAGEVGTSTNAATNSRPRLDYDRDHIFYAILQYALKFSSEKTRYTYFYSLSQKLLRACWQREFAVSTYYLEKLESDRVARESFENDISYHALYSVFNPAIAYYYYQLKKDYNAAEARMLRSLDDIEFLIKHGFNDGVFMKIEQHLNTFRVYHNAGDLEKAVFYARMVIRFLLSSEKESYDFPFAVVMRSQKQLNAILNLFFNGMIYKSIARTEDPEQFFHNSYLVSIFSDLDVPYNTSMDSDLGRTIDAFVLIINGKDEEAVSKILANERVFDPQTPVSIRYFIMAFLLHYGDVREKADEQLKNSIFTYLRTGLNLPETHLKVFNTYKEAA